MRVVVIDDHPFFRDGVTRGLHNSGQIRVIGEAGDGREGLEVITGREPRRRAGRLPDARYGRAGARARRRARSAADPGAAAVGASPTAPSSTRRSKKARPATCPRTPAGPRSSTPCCGWRRGTRSCRRRSPTGWSSRSGMNAQSGRAGAQRARAAGAERVRARPVDSRRPRPSCSSASARSRPTPSGSTRSSASPTGPPPWPRPCAGACSNSDARPRPDRRAAGESRDVLDPGPARLPRRAGAVPAAGCAAGVHGGRPRPGSRRRTTAPHRVLVVVGYALWTVGARRRGPSRGGVAPVRWMWVALLVDAAALGTLTLVAGVNSAEQSWTADILVSGLFLIPVLAATQLRPFVCAAVAIPTTVVYFAASVATKDANGEPLVVGHVADRSVMAGLAAACIGLSRRAAVARGDDRRPRPRSLRPARRPDQCRVEHPGPAGRRSARRRAAVRPRRPARPRGRARRSPIQRSYERLEHALAADLDAVAGDGERPAPGRARGRRAGPGRAGSRDPRSRAHAAGDHGRHAALARRAPGRSTSCCSPPRASCSRNVVKHAGRDVSPHRA